MTKQSRKNAKNRSAVPCSSCGRRSIEPGPNALRALPGDLLEQLRTVVLHGGPATKIDRLLPLVLEAFEGYERENEWLSEQLDLADVDVVRARDEARIMAEATKCNSASIAALEIVRIAHWIQVADFIVGKRRGALLTQAQADALAAMIGQQMHWDQLPGEPAESRDRMAEFVRLNIAALRRAHAAGEWDEAHPPKKGHP